MSHVVCSRIDTHQLSLLNLASKRTGLTKSVLIERAISLWLNVTNAENCAKNQKKELTCVAHVDTETNTEKYTKEFMKR